MNDDDDFERWYERRKELEKLVKPGPDGMLYPLPNWGVLLGGVYYSPSLSCPNCGWGEEYRGFDVIVEHIIGLSHDCPMSRGGDWQDVDVGALIFECPRCFTKFWFHARGLSIIMVVAKRNDLYEVISQHYKNKKGL